MEFKIYTRAIIKNNKGEILFLKKNGTQKYGAGEYMLPGGTVEFGENIEHTLIRELKEETNLTVKSLKLFDMKKMIINDEHWLGIYYIVTIKNYSDLKNMEPEKHSFCNFCIFDKNINLKHSDLIIKYLDKNINNTIFQENIYTDEYSHTMGNSIYKYIDMKIHHLLKEKKYKYIKVIGQYDRKHSIISKYEKKGKLFNWKRPTVIIDDDTIIVKCFPGEDYIKHYYYLINTYLKNNNINGIETSYEFPSKKLLENIFEKYEFKNIENSDYVILGHIDKIGLFNHIDYKEINDFKYKIGNLNGKKITLLGVEFSIWGDIGGYLIKKLSKYNIKNIIYIGKLGILNKGIEPNLYLATGNESLVNGNIINWKNIFDKVKNKNLIHGKHNTCESIILENKDWLSKNNEFDFVDPEIGQYAKFANKYNLGFSYLHIISDNLSVEKKYLEDLSNERKKSILEKRKKLFKLINNILLKTL